MRAVVAAVHAHRQGGYVRGVGADRTHRGVHPGLALWSPSERDTSTPRSVSGGLSLRSCARTMRRAASRNQPLEPNCSAGRRAGGRRGRRGPREAAPATCSIARRAPRLGGRRPQLVVQKCNYLSASQLTLHQFTKRNGLASSDRDGVTDHHLSFLHVICVSLLV